jgi:putative FmdB family regulatory protein
MLYSYWCKHCQKYFEILVPLKDCDMEIKCKYCGKVLRKLVTSCSFRVN